MAQVQVSSAWGARAAHAQVGRPRAALTTTVKEKDPPPNRSVPTPTRNAARRHGCGILSLAEAGSRCAQLQAMGFDEKAARDALTAHTWDVNKALDWLLTCEPQVSEMGGSASGSAPTVLALHATAEHPLSAESLVERTDNSLIADVVPNDFPEEPCLPKSSCTEATDARAEHSLTAEEALEERLRFAPEATSAIADEGAFLRSVLANDARDSQMFAESKETLLKVNDVENAFPSMNVCDASESSAQMPVCDAGAAMKTAPCKQLMSVRCMCPGDASCNMLGVEQESFVCVWTETKTDNGWVHAEACDGGAAGWLPITALEEAPVGYRWAVAVRPWEATDELQMGVAEGSILLVNVDSRTGHGWFYAEAANSDVRQEAVGDMHAAGWVPDYCVDWPLV